MEGFIKAFYLNERDLERWIKEHTVSFHISNQFSSAGLVGLFTFEMPFGRACY